MLRNYEAISMLKNMGVKLIANVILGAPFLSVEERVSDTVKTISGLISQGIDYMVLFPVNIKPYTLVKFLYDNNYYKRVNSSEILEVLLNFNKKQLPNIDIAWFEPEHAYIPAYGQKGLSPLYCSDCGKLLLKHLRDYNDSCDGLDRYNILLQAKRDLCLSCQDDIYNYTNPDIDSAYKLIEEFIYSERDLDDNNRCSHSYKH
jgi:uncharacterized Fe-S cluster-containing MiaB family protein